jgi:hypothetical protein
MCAKSSSFRVGFDVSLMTFATKTALRWHPVHSMQPQNSPNIFYSSGKSCVYFSYFLLLFVLFCRKVEKQSPVLAKVLARPIVQVEFAQAK